MKNIKKIISLIMSLLIACGVLAAGTSAFAYGDALNAVSEGGETTVKPFNLDADLILDYKATKTFEFEAENVPEGAEIHIYVNGEDKGATDTVTVEDAVENYTVEAKVIDANGKEIASSGVINVTVRNSIVDRAKSSLNKFSDALLDIVGAFFMTILYRLKILDFTL